ncbi:MAG: hypothetical protein KF715_08495 [Candidatus Didemnitutus sp.]|nr:hypothetical protein [Candidatus Didemnitutus sp.]
MSASKMGATVLYCGHDASFPADVFKVGSCNIVVANGDLDKPGILTRPASADCTHHVSDALGGVWKPNRGFFAVPEAACQELKPGVVEAWYGPREAKKGGRK